MAQKIVTLDPNQSEEVLFAYTPLEARIHTVSVDGLKGSFNVIEMPGIVIWDLPYGLDEDPSAVNIWTYPSSATMVVLADVDSTMPDDLLIWYYSPTEDWQSYKKGWGASNTLKYLVPGESYTGIVTTACRWEIPQAETELPPSSSYSLGIYYFYPEGYEGSSDPYAWHDNWDEWCRWLVGYKAALLANYCEGEMPIIFVVKQSIPLTFNIHSWDMARLISGLPGYDSSDFCIAISENSFHAGLLAFPGYHTVLLDGWDVEQSIRGMEGEGYRINFEFTHELGHLFGLDHCSTPPCPMSQCQINYDDWLAMGKKLWFCEKHRPQILNAWSMRDYE